MTTPASPITAPTLADIDEMARAVLDDMPEQFLRFARDIVVQVVDFPDDDVCAEMDLESPFDILGLYQGIALDEKTTDMSGALPDMVFLYRRPILDYWCESGLDLRHVVRHVLIHEIGHHFGFSDAEMDAIEAQETHPTSA
jgi:predicted Zn-dependent protease with MMP-like domain